MNKKENKILITDNPLAQSSLKRDVLTAFERCGELEKLVKDFGLQLTRDIVTDCLTLRKDIDKKPVEGTTKFVGEESDRKNFSKEFAAVEVWRNNEHLQTAFEAMLHEVEEQGGRAADIKQRKDTLICEFEKLLDDIYSVFHVGNLTIQTAPLLKYFDIKDESIVLVDNIDERLKEDTATYATKEKSKKAFHIHREIAEKLNRFADLMTNVSRCEFIAELDKLFYLSDDGTIQTSPVDYDLFN